MTKTRKLLEDRVNYINKRLKDRCVQKSLKLTHQVSIGYSITVYDGYFDENPSERCDMLIAVAFDEMSAYTQGILNSFDFLT